VTSTELWSRLLEGAAPNRRLRIILAEARLESLSDSSAIILVKPTMLTSAQQLVPDLETLLSQLRAKPTRVEIKPDQAEIEPPLIETTPRVNIAEHPLVKQAVELFGGRIIGSGPRQRTS